MASTGITWSNITVDNGAITDLRQLIQLETLEGGVFGQFHDVMTGVMNGDKLAGVGEFAEVGTPDGTSCTPTYNASQARSVEKTWVTGEWVVAEKICYKDLDSTAARRGMNSGTEIADISNTIIADIVAPKIQAAIDRMFWRLAWFGNTEADNIAGGGTITAGKDPALFTACDGFFKKLAVIYGAATARLTNLAANEQATYALQFSAFTNAMTVLDNLIFNAPLKLRNATDKMIMCTQSVADQFEKERTATAYTELVYNIGENGMQYFKYRGVDIYPIQLWDSYIQEYEDNATKWNNPHRAVFTTKSNLKVGTPSNDMVGTLDMWFSKDDQDFKMLAKDKMGVLIMDDTLVQVAI